MSRPFHKPIAVVLMLSLLLPMSPAWGRGGGGGGRGGGGGGGGMRGGGGGGGGMRGGGGGGGMGGGRPSPSVSRSPSFSSPSAHRPTGNTRPSTPGGSRPTGSRPNQSPGMNRPQGGDGFAMSRPGTVNRPPISQTRPGGGAGTRPEIGTKPNLPGTNLPGTTRPGTGGGLANNRPGVWDHPSTLPGQGTRPGSGERPTTLPGLPGANRPGTLPGLGSRPGDRPAGNRPNWADHNVAGNLNDLHQNNLNNIHNNFNVGNDWNRNQGNWQNWQNNHPNWHEDWHDWHHDWNHNDWHHGYWHGNYNSYWNTMWNAYPVAAAFGLTAWGVNRMSYWFGYAPYYNPYWAAPMADSSYYDYSQPLIVNQPVTQQTIVPTDNGQALPPEVAPQSLTALDQARQAFAQGSYTEALQLTEQALQDSPRDAAIHEFRALTLFAIGKYQEAAATLHAVLAVGPGWDWTTLIGLYGDSSSTYTDQLRALESFLNKNPDRPDSHFVLGYHYLSAGHSDAAAKQFQLAYDQEPKDHVAAQLVTMLTGKTPGGEDAAPTPAAEPADSEKPAIPVQALQGTWMAKNDGGAKFSLALNDNKDFTWTYTQGDQTETVQGVYDVDGDTLAMTPDGGGVMLAQVTEPQGGKFHFQMIGAAAGDPGLDFQK